MSSGDQYMGDWDKDLYQGNGVYINQKGDRY